MFLECLGPMCVRTTWSEVACSEWWDRIPRGPPSSHVVQVSFFPPFLLPYFFFFFFPPYSLFMSSSPHWEKSPLRFLPHENFYWPNSCWIWQFNCEIGFSSLELSTRFSPKQPSLLYFASPQSTPVESEFHYSFCTWHLDCELMIVRDVSMYWGAGLNTDFLLSLLSMPWSFLVLVLWD